MSFITKRERVFNEYDLVDLPPRNEGKLKAYTSCTDARAWSHFCSSKSEHLTEIIKRNNDITVTPKYVPTKVIVDTIMVSKNMEIGRLRRKIEEFEQMLAVYEELDLDCDQKCEIAKQHANIRAANKDLDEMFLNLDTSGFTEGIDSEAFETGKSRGDAISFVGGKALTYGGDGAGTASIKSRGAESDRSHGDEWTYVKEMASKSNQAGFECPCDASVSVHDPRIEEMQEEIICKDAKLNAMRNSLAIMENDVCEPYGIYAHIYTALEKIYGILSQNSKYRQYLNLMTAGKDIRCVDIKGKILFKMKVLEKFCLALIAPCSSDMNTADPRDCTCYHAEVVTRVEPTYSLTPSETDKGPDVKRAQLVADIMESDEMKEILSKESTSTKEDIFENGDLLDPRYNINEENQKRLKDLQESYDELLNIYENLKHESDCLRIKCSKYDQLETEFENLRSQLREYGLVWNEKEHYRKRSEDLDNLKEQYIVLAEESSGLENKLKAESEINRIKSATIDELRNQNILLEKKISEVYMAFEKEKNALQCKLQESECKCMCQEQQIKSLSTQIVELIQQEPEKAHPHSEETSPSLVLIDENQALKGQIKNLQDIEDDYQDKLMVIEELKGEIEVWKNSFEKASEHNKYLEECIESFRDERQRLEEENQLLLQSVKDKTAAVENLMQVIASKSLEINKSTDENQNLQNKLFKLKESYEDHVSKLESERQLALDSLQISRQESHERLQKVKDYDEFVQKQEDLSNTIEEKMREYESTKKVLKQKIEENERLKQQLASLQNEDHQSKKTIELVKKDSLILERKLSNLENISQQFMDLKEAYEKLGTEKKSLELELKQKATHLDSAYSIKLNKKESAELLKQSEAIKEELAKLNLENENLTANNKLLHKNLSFLRDENDSLKRMSAQLSITELELSDLKNNFNELLNEKKELDRDFETKNQEINNLCNALENKIEENRSLHEKIKMLQMHNLEATSNIKTLENDNLEKLTALNAVRRESSVIMEKLQHHEILESEYSKLKTAHEQIMLEKERLQRALDAQLSDLSRLERENNELYDQTSNLITHNSDLEDALVTTRNQLSSETPSPVIVRQSYANLLQEIQKMKDEKVAGRIKIRDLLDTLDETEHFISELKEQVCARDDKIAIMQNNINALEDEVRRLHSTLDQAIDTGFKIKDNSFHTIDQTRQQLEAHHSKATHNIKMELAILQDENTKLEDQLSITKLKTAETVNDKQNYQSQITELKNERNLLAKDIKQLEMHCAGDSLLMPEKCEVNELLSSLDRIRKSYDARRSKSTSLEHTLDKVKTTSQVFINKANETKKYFENEMQKIQNDKEDAIKDKVNMEQQLVSLKEELEGQIAHDESVIKDLELEIENQKLIIDKINDSTKNYISKLEKEMQSLQDLYQNSISKVCEMQEKLKLATIENDKKEDIMQKLYADYEEKSKEVADLQLQLADLSKKAVVNSETQVSSLGNQKDVSLQTEHLTNDNILDPTKLQSKSNLDESYKKADKIADMNMVTRHKPRQKESGPPVSELLPQQKPPSVNEVQILAANVEPTFDFVKSSYLNYKIKRLGQGQLEHHSIPYVGDSVQSTSVETPEIDINIQSTRNGESNKAVKFEPETRKKVDSNLINIYNNEKTTPETTQTRDSQSLGQQTNDSLRTESTGYTKFIDNDTSTTPLNKSTDLLLIYRESENICEKKPYSQNEVFSDEQTQKTNGKAASLTLNSVNKMLRNKRSMKYDNNPQAFYAEINEKRDDNIKTKLNIDLPRVVNNDHDSTSTATISDGDKKSEDSYTVAIFTSPKKNNSSDSKIMIEVSPKDIAKKYESHSMTKISNDDEIYEESRNSTYYSTETTSSMKQEKELSVTVSQENTDKPNFNSGISTEGKVSKRSGKKSHHELSRVEADVFLVKSKSNQHDHLNENADQGRQNDFALEYLLDTAIREGDLHKLSSYGVNNALQRTRSDESHINPKTYERRGSNSRSAEFSPSRSKTSERSQTMSVERSVMAKLDVTSEYYEQVIQNLRNTLENVEKDHKRTVEAIKVQYTGNINNIINEHNQGVKNMQSLHEETLQDIMKMHENEVDNLRAMSIEAMRKADKLEKEILSLKTKCKDSSAPVLDEAPSRPCSPEVRKRRQKSRPDAKTLTKTTVEAFNVKPKTRQHGPCTCSLDVNISDTIRNIFEQVDVEQRKLAEIAYLKYIVSKISNGNIEGLDAQELSFLHLKVCRTWKLKLSKEEALQKKIDSLEVELINKQKNTQQHMAELDRKVAEEKRRLEAVREAVCRSIPSNLPDISLSAQADAERDFCCGCDTSSEFGLLERRSAGDLEPAAMPGGLRQKKIRTDSNRVPNPVRTAVLARLDVEERRERKLYSDEPPTRLRRHHERLPPRPHKK